MHDSVSIQSSMTEPFICSDTLLQSMQPSDISLITQLDGQFDFSDLENDSAAYERDRSRRSAAPSPEPRPFTAETTVS